MSEMFLQATGIGVAKGLATVLLVDGENISHALAGQIIAKTQPFGSAMVSRVYGDVARLPAWDAAAGFEMIHTGHAKNGADMRICIDALDLVHRGGVGRVVIASSDRDFTHLAQYLRAKGIEVVGMGAAKTHESFRKACGRFSELGTAAVMVVPKPAPKPIAATQILDPVNEQINKFLAQEGPSGLQLTVLGQKMRQMHGFIIGDHDQKTWRRFLGLYPKIYDLDPKGPSARVRLK